MATRRPAPTHKRISAYKPANDQKIAATPAAAAFLFKSPITGKTVDVGAAPVYTALFGFLYFAKYQVWKHALGELVLVILTGGISWLIYPIYSEKIMRHTLVSRNWIAMASPEVDRTAGKFVVLLVTLVWTVAFCVVMTFVAAPYL